MVWKSIAHDLAHILCEGAFIHYLLRFWTLDIPAKCPLASPILSLFHWVYIYSNLVKKFLMKREADSYVMLPTIEMPNYVSLDTLSYCMGIFPWENHVKSFMNGKYILLIYEKIGGCLGHLPNLRHWWWYIKMHIESEWMWPKRRPLIFLPTYICTYLRYTNGIFLMGYHEPYSIKRP